MTYNIRFGLGTDPTDPTRSGNLDLERIAEIVRREDPDIVALQEVDRFNPRSLRVDQPTALGEMLNMHHCFAANVVYEHDGAEYGVAILSRFPIISFTNTPLPTTDGWEVRGLMQAVVQVPGVGRLTIFNTHLQVGHADTEAAAAIERGEQAAVIAERIDAITSPVILMGDFNAQPADPELDMFNALKDAWIEGGDGGYGFTIPAHPAAHPRVRIDIIYVSEDIDVASARVVTEYPAGYASDHHPVVAELNVNTQARSS